MTDRELLQQALNSLETWAKLIDYQYTAAPQAMTALQLSDNAGQLAIEALRKRLAQPTQKPVAWLDPWAQSSVTLDYDAHGDRGIPLYTSPQTTAKAVLCKSEIKRLAIQMGLFGAKPEKVE